MVKIMAHYQNELSPKEKAFCEYYIECYNAPEAYQKAYPDSTILTAKSAAYQVLKRPRVKEYLKQLQAEAFERAMINPERVAIKLAEIAFAQKGDEYYNTQAQLKALDLIQKQMGLQQQKISADVNNDIVINIEGDKKDE